LACGTAKNRKGGVYDSNGRGELVNYVVGSGPAGVACAMALLDRGAEVTMLDAGVQLEASNREQVRRLAQIAPESWTVDDLRFLKQHVKAETSGIPLKRAYGSDFPYRNLTSTEYRFAGSDTMASFAFGGFSNVWGAAVLPYRESDLRQWPISLAELEPHYKAVTQFLPLARTSNGNGADALDAMFPLYSDKPGRLDSSKQAHSWLTELASSRATLAENGIHYGGSRLAVTDAGCVYCNLCMYGCPYELIYNSASTVESLRQRPGFHYIGNVAVERVREEGSQVSIEGRRGGEGVTFAASRVFLACGALSTSAVLLRSAGAYEISRRLLDSQYYLLPLLRYRRERGACDAKGHTLAQAFLEIEDRAISERTAHLQIYTYNELFADAMGRLLGPASGLLRPVTTRLLERLLLVQGYLPSELSGYMDVRLQSGTGGDTLEVRAVSNERTLPAMRSVVRKLRANAGSLRARALGMMLRPGKPGRGYHTGGTFPMRRSPAPLETDTLGRLAGVQRVHAVDSSVFPDIPATTITFTLMANAHRIGSEAPL
jgi:choline dehydrogenase-like flavoprotein